MTHTEAATVVGYFPDMDAARRVAQTLVDSGFRRDQVELTSEEHLRHLHGSSYETQEGGVSGFFKRLFGADADTRRYEEAIHRGGAILTVHANGTEQDRAAEIMNTMGAVDIDRHAEAWDREPRQTIPGTASRDGQRIPVVEEELRIGKRQIQRGGVRIYSHVTEEPVEEQVRLREEHVHVDRRPANRDATPADLNRRDEVIEVTATSEEPVVDKRIRVVEEIVVGKETAERVETVRDTVRRTRVEVENLGKQDTGIDDYREHFRSHYGHKAEYDHYAPAYRYGSQLASREEYRNRRWDELEPVIRRDYERHYPESRWEQMKDAVRHGWERVTGHR
ncbi:MAG: YsnF/AvaK domain-containing protein [Bryobacterales bacterium]|nr:YsnF/AvaK domain-containing protein [Bryobacterales bacterium]